MDNMHRIIPFGLLFEEPVPSPREPVVAIYDEQADLSYAEDSNGRRIPWVELGLAGTDTFTKAEGEGTDRDLQDDQRGYRRVRRSLSGTDTITEVAAEPTDRD